MTDGDHRAVVEAHEGLLESPMRDLHVHLRYVEVPKSVYRKHYDLMSNRILWFTQHYLLEQEEDALSAEKLQDAWKNGYRRGHHIFSGESYAKIVNKPHDECFLPFEG